MKKIIKALSKQLFGAKYESIWKSLLAGGILFFAARAAEIEMAIAPFILNLTSTALTGCIMWQTLHGSRHSEALQGMFMLPFENRSFVFSYTLAVGGYTLITKTLLVWALFLAVGSWTGFEIMVALLCGFSACFVSAAAYLLCRKGIYVLPVLGIVCILAVILGVRQSMAVLTASAVSFVVAAVYLFFTDAYGFCHSITAKRAVRYTRNRGNILAYLMRYLMANKNYLFNTAGLCGVACFLPLLFGEFENLNVLPIGLAILSLNTPICTLLSCDPDLEQAVKTIPGQASRFCSQYCLFIACVNFAISCIYLCGWQLVNGSVGVVDVWMAILFAVQSSILSVALEWVRPIRNWKTESDLWHHPRKYLVPLVMLLLGAFVGTWTITIWIWSAILLVECCVLLYLTRRL